MSYEEGTTIHRSTVELLDKLDKYLKQRDQYKAENKKLKEEVERLKDIIRDEEEWKLLESEEEWL